MPQHVTVHLPSFRVLLRDGGKHLLESTIIPLVLFYLLLTLVGLDRDSQDVGRLRRFVALYDSPVLAGLSFPKQQTQPNTCTGYMLVNPSGTYSVAAPYSCNPAAVVKVG